MKTPTTSSSALATAPDRPSLVEDAYGALTESFEQFCLMAGIESLTHMMNEDVARLAGDRYEHCSDKPGYHWGHTQIRPCRSAARGRCPCQCGKRPVQIRGIAALQGADAGEVR